MGTGRDRLCGREGVEPLKAEDRSAILAELAAPDSPFEVVPVDAEIAARVAGVPRELNADPGDRLLVATAEVLGARLVSADRTLPAMTSTTVIW